MNRHGPSPWGEGRPGWHIECSAMSVTHLGPQFEIHGGGRDLAFPHHEAERIQSEGATGVRPVVRHWVHTGMVHLAEEKMSKSSATGDGARPARPMAGRCRPTPHPAPLSVRSRMDRVAAPHGLGVRAALDRGCPTAGPERPGRCVPRRSELAARGGPAALANDLDIHGAVSVLDRSRGLTHGRHDEATRRAAGACVHDIATRVRGFAWTRSHDRLDNTPASVRLGEVVRQRIQRTGAGR